MGGHWLHQLAHTSPTPACFIDPILRLQSIVHALLTLSPAWRSNIATRKKKGGEVADHEKESSWMPVEMDCRQLEHTPVATTTVRWSTRARIWTNNSGGSSCHLSSTFSKTPPASSTTSGQSVAWIIRFNLVFTPGGADSISSSSDAQKNEEGPDLWSDSPLAFFFSRPNSSTSLSPRSRGWQSAGIS